MFRGFLDESDTKVEILEALFNSCPSKNSDKISAISNLVMQISGETRHIYLKKLATCLTNDHNNHDILDLHVYFVAEISLNLANECQFFDNEIFLRAFSEIINEGNQESEIAVSIIPIAAVEYRLFNFCVLINFLCQRKNPPKALFTEILKEYMSESFCKTRPDLNRLRIFAENTLGSTFWPSPKSRFGPGAGGPPDLMNMLQGLLGTQMKL